MRCKLLLLITTILAIGLTLESFVIMWSYRVDLIFWAASIAPQVSLLLFSVFIVSSCALLGQLVGRCLG
jgi:hypothetical protein